MKLKRKKGATLGLVAVCVLVIIVLGVGFFILSQILGGGREVANATDAGVLTVARKCLSPTLINVTLSGDSGTNPVNDFIAFDPSNPSLAASTGKIDMLGINRVVAQAVMVALNAQEINTPAASGHAQNVSQAAKNVATQLRNLIQGGTSPLPNEFNGVAQTNNTKMFDGNLVQLTGPGLQSTFMRSGYSTNVFVNPALLSALPVSPPSNLTNQNPNRLKHNNADDYMAGYINFAVPAGTGTTVNIAGIPIFPNQKPHLVDIGEYDFATNNAGANGNAPFGGGTYLPPNAFRADTRALENRSGNFGGAVACSLVGCLDRDFVAAMPRGYVRIKNGEDANITNSPIISNPVVDGTNDVFNNELWPPNGGGVDVSNNGVYALNSNPAGQQYIADWAAYNAGTSTVQPTLPSAGGGGGVNIITPTGFRALTDADVTAITNVTTDCDAFDGWDRGRAPGGCFFPSDAGAAGGDVVYAIQQQTGANSQQVPATGNGTGYTAVEYQKHMLLSRRYGGGRCASVVPVSPSGMKRFNTGNCFATPSSPVAFGVPGSPLDYINQIGQGNAACANDILNKIWNRMRQADSSISLAQVRTALASQSLDLGETLYLYSPGPSQVQCIAGTPAFYFSASLSNDGQSSSAIYNCEHQYNISRTIVNATNGQAPGTCNGHGDANFHQAPFSDGPGYLPGIDRAVFTPASGWRNLLGDIEFQNEAAGAGTFCKPN
jgi:hypothetical protein